jgi:rubrerythrin
MKRKFKDLDVKEVLALAISVEDTNTQRFGTLADMYQDFDDELYKLFCTLRDEEVDHTRILNEEWKRRYGDEPKPAISESDIDDVIEAVDLEHGEHGIFDDLDRAGALKLVEISERNALNMYKRAAAESTDPGLKALYLDLAAMEEGHADAVDDMGKSG